MTAVQRLLAPLALALAVALGLTACASAAQPVPVSADTVLIDVRTPDEFAAGHLDGAINIDVQSPAFDALIAELPTDGDYVVYCRSGNRSAAAIERMSGLGFTALVNAGSLEAASAATGVEIVR